MDDRPSAAGSVTIRCLTWPSPQIGQLPIPAALHFISTWFAYRYPKQNPPLWASKRWHVFCISEF
jgi:hypothetical protein